MSKQQRPNQPQRRTEIGSVAWDGILDSVNFVPLNYYSHFIDYVQATNPGSLCDSFVTESFDGDKLVVPRVVSVSGEVLWTLSPLPMGSNELRPESLPAEINISGLHCTKWSDESMSYCELQLTCEQSCASAQIVALRGLENISSLVQGFSRGHRRNYSRSVASGETTLEFTSCSPPDEVDTYFDIYREVHLLAAGSNARPAVSYDFMRQLIGRGLAFLFVAVESNGQPLSFLYIDQRASFARGWSQVNVPSLPPGSFPRLKLEADALMFFASRGVDYYHLGEFSELLTDPDPKVASIHEYKTRFNPITVSCSCVKLSRR